MRKTLLFLLLASTTAAQEKTAPPWQAACGPSDVKFDVTRTDAPSPSEPATGKALVYIIEDLGYTNCFTGCTTLRIGFDGSWIGATQGNSRFSFSVDAGEHHLCANWQSVLGRFSSIHSLNSFTAEPGKIYYFRARVWAGDRVPFLDLDAVNPDEGRYLVATSPPVTSNPKK
jgi:hypothetical protein